MRKGLSAVLPLPSSTGPRHSDTLSNTRHFTSVASLVPRVLTRHSTQDTVSHTPTQGLHVRLARRVPGKSRPEVFPASKVPSPLNPPAHQPALPPATKPFPVFFQGAPGWGSLQRGSGGTSTADGLRRRLYCVMAAINRRVKEPFYGRALRDCGGLALRREGARRAGEGRWMKRKHSLSPAWFIAPRD